MSLNRREFVRSAAGLTALSISGHTARLALGAQHEKRVKPVSRRPPEHAVVIASANGLRACERAMTTLRDDGDPVDAAVAGVNVVEDDPTDHSVGYGGLPNEDGVVELDACVMHGPTHKGGAVAALRDVRFASRVAALVMRRTDHVLLVGEGAKRFAVAHGFKVENLLTDDARRIWLRWKESHSDRDDWIRNETDAEAARTDRAAGFELTHGTITCMALTRNGDLGGCTTTSGLSYKIPGRVGDSPILGAGLYVDNEVGACGSTGRGEANLVNCSSFLVVELMRQGRTPAEACRSVMQRVAERTEKRLLDARGIPNYQLKLYAVRRDGLVGGACMRGEGEMAVCHDAGSRLIAIEGVYPALPERV
jgi:N4-(beta-N-acetylglucosaminyl)-L-asparaginase